MNNTPAWNCPQCTLESMNSLRQFYFYCTAPTIMQLKPEVGWTSFELYLQRHSAAAEQTNLPACKYAIRQVTIVQERMWLDKHWPPTTHAYCEWQAEADVCSALQKNKWFRKSFQNEGDKTAADKQVIYVTAFKISLWSFYERLMIYVIMKIWFNHTGDMRTTRTRCSWWESSPTQQHTSTRGLKIALTQTVLCGSAGWLDGSLGPEAPLNFRCHHKLCSYAESPQLFKRFFVKPHMGGKLWQQESRSLAVFDKIHSKKEKWLAQMDATCFLKFTKSMEF